MWGNLADSDGNNTNTGSSDPNNLGGFSADYYLSSTEHSSIPFNSYAQDFYGGGQFYKDQVAYSYRVRAVRAF